jgi:hypothetical protein
MSPLIVCGSTGATDAVDAVALLVPIASLHAKGVFDETVLQEHYLYIAREATDTS